MRALVVSNMLPDARHPERGSFVRDQVAALRALGDLDVELYEFAPGARSLARAARGLRARFAGPPGGAGKSGRELDIVHAHFGLTAWPSLAVPARAHALTVHGTDLSHPRTRMLTRAALPLLDLVAAVSEPLLDELPRRTARRARVLPCGVDMDRMRPLAREQAREQLGLERQGPYLLFAADPARPEKHHDRALALSRALGVELLTLGGVDPGQMSLWINSANAVVVPSDREGFGLATLEALACDVPVLATPVGIHEQALAGVDGALCAPFDLAVWRDALEPHVHAHDPRVSGRASAARFSTATMAQRVVEAWRATLARAA